MSITLSLDIPGSDTGELDTAVRSLREEIDDLGVESVELVKSPQQVAGAKSVDVVEWGTLAVAIVPHLVPPLVQYLREWSARGSRSVHLTTVVDGRQIAIKIDPGSIPAGDLGNFLRELGLLSNRPSEPA